MSEGAMKELNQSILKRVECPACLDYMTRPVYVCVAGHSICSKCHASVGECPVCSAALTQSRNYGLESVSDLLNFPCVFTGCTVSLSQPYLNHHMLSCGFRPYCCPFKGNDEDCNWAGRRAELQEHVAKEHRDRSWMREDNKDRWKEDKGDCSEIQLAFAFEENFCIKRKIIGGPDFRMSWIVQYIGPIDRVKLYTYQIEVPADPLIRNMSITEVCHHNSVPVEDIIASGEHVTIPLDIFRKFASEDKSVWYKLKIIKTQVKATRAQ